MSILQAIILGLVQGLTEFIPVSSSGHLLLLHHAFGITEQGLGFDVALHIGTFLALCMFFYMDIVELARGVARGGKQRRLALILAAATVPAVIVGIFLQRAAETSFRSPILVSLTLALMALVMLAAERYAVVLTSKVEKISPLQGILIGLAQAVALIPGISRSGSTITAGLFAGLDRVTATRFSFLLSIPITFGAILKFAFDGDTLTQVRDETGIFVVGIITAFVSGVVAIRFLLRYVAKHNLNVFAYYRLGLALFTLIAIAYF